MEGPFINEKYKGAQNPKYIHKPSFDFIKDYKDIIRLISYSPEMDDNFEFTKKVKKETDIVLSICHTDATYNIGKEAKNLGVTNITHLFNGMTPFSSKCSAWNHGPVFGKVYFQYKEYGYHLIEESEDEDIELDPELKEVVDAVIKYFGIYGANTLEYFTHQEDPWIKAINSENKIIEKSDIKEYGEKIIKEYNINSPKEIYKYSEAMFDKFKKENYI